MFPRELAVLNLCPQLRPRQGAAATHRCYRLVGGVLQASGLQLEVVLESDCCGARSGAARRRCALVSFFRAIRRVAQLTASPLLRHVRGSLAANASAAPPSCSLSAQLRTQSISVATYSLDTDHWHSKTQTARTTSTNALHSLRLAGARRRRSARLRAQGSPPRRRRGTSAARFGREERVRRGRLRRRLRRRAVPRDLARRDALRRGS